MSDHPHPQKPPPQEPEAYNRGHNELIPICVLVILAIVYFIVKGFKEGL